MDGEDHAARRDRIMAEFRDGAIQVVGNCDLISEGFDAPGCSVIMMGSPTRSITRYLQQAGRAMRPGPGKQALILGPVGYQPRVGAAGRGDVSGRWRTGRCRRGARRSQAARVPAMPHDVLRAEMPGVCLSVSAPEVEETRTDLVEATGRPESNGKRPNRRSDVWRGA